MRTPGRFVSFVLLSRPHFLVGGALMFALGAASSSTVGLAGYLLAQAMVTSSQLTAQYVNEFADVDGDRSVVNRTMFSGGSGVLVSDWLQPRVALRAARVTTVVSIVLAIVVGVRTPVAGLIGVGSLAISWGYSMPPVRLSATGWGELAATIAVVGLVPVTAVTAMGESPSAPLWWAIGVLLPVHLAMILVFELPDLAADAATGKRGLAVRLGEPGTRSVVAAAIGAGIVVAVLADLTGGLPGAVWAFAAAVPGLVAMAVGLRAGRFSTLTAAAVASFVLVAVGLVVALD